MFRLAAVAVLLAAFALRLPVSGTPPPGLYRDEAYNGLDAAGILEGRLHVIFPANNGREPLFLYLTAPFVGVLGPSPAAPRLAAAFAGTAAVAAAVALGAALFRPGVGLLAGAWLAVAPWPVLLSRVGLRAGLLPLVLALAVAATVRGARRGERRWVLLGGALAGLTAATYLAAWAGPVLAALVACWWLTTGRTAGRRAPAPGRKADRRAPAPGRKADRRAPALWAAAALTAALPLLVVYARDPGAALTRVTQVATAWPLGAAGRAPGAQPDADGMGAELARNAGAAVGLFTRQGDRIARHNVPGRPLFGPPSALLWALGLVLLVASARRRAGSVVTLSWLAAMLLPTVLAEDAPHFLRAAGLLPAAVLPAAVAAAWLAALAGRRSAVARAVVLAVALAAVGTELRATLGHFEAAAEGDAAERLYYDFEAGAVALAADVNQVLGRGWRGGWAVEDATDESAVTGAPGGVWLDRRLRDGWPSVPYLVPTERVTLTDPYDPVFTTGPGTAYLWPHALDLPRVWSARAPGLCFRVRDGSLERGDLETAPRLLYRAVEAQPTVPVTRPLAAFDNGLLLSRAALDTDAGVAATGANRVWVETEWALDRAVDRDVTAFVQVLDGGSLLDGRDAPLGDGWLPVPLWRIGDRLVERRALDVPGGYDPARHDIIVGLYEWPSVERVPARLEDGSRAGQVTLRLQP